MNNYFPDKFGQLNSDDTDMGMIKKFHIDVTGYEEVDIIAYNHYIKNKGGFQYVKTPYSHDGTSTVPEPDTIFLLFFGLIGFAWLRKNPKKSK